MADVTDKVSVLWVFIYNIYIKIAAILMVVLYPSCYWLEALIRATSIAVQYVSELFKSPQISVKTRSSEQTLLYCSTDS